jgi:hypothetical protein
MKAIQILERAAELVGGDRANTHGNMRKVHNSIAILWNAYLEIRTDPSAPLSPADIAMMMVLLKAARTQNGRMNADDSVDGAGYFGIYGELVHGDE